jgi:sugar lactone lactonase YvrE
MAAAMGLLIALVASGTGGDRAVAAPQVSAVVAGEISTVVGGVGGPARGTSIALTGRTVYGFAIAPCGVAYAVGRLYVGDSATVRAISAQTDWLTTPAGVGLAAFGGDGGPAASAWLDGACGIAGDHHGNLVVADSGNSLIRVVARQTGTFYGQAMTAGHIYTVAGTGAPWFSGDGGPATKADLYYPNGVAVDAAGNLVIADTDNNRIRVVAETTGTFYGQAMTAGAIYTVAGMGTPGFSGGFSGDGGPATAASLAFPDGVTVDHAGNLVIADTRNARIRVVAARTGTFYHQAMTAGDIYTVAGDGPGSFSGDGGPATKADVAGDSVAVDAWGNLVIADTGNERIRIVAAKTGTFYGQSMIAGDIYTVAGSGARGFSGDGGPATQAKMDMPEAVALDAAGNLVIADSYNNRVRVVAASTGTFYGQAMTAGAIYTIAGELKPGSGDGGTPTAAELGQPEGVAVDAAANILIADTADAQVRVVAASTGTFYGHAMKAGNIYSVAGTGIAGLSGNGGQGTKARLNSPASVAPGAAGGLAIADTGNGQIRVLAATAGTYYGQAMTAGNLYTVAGTSAAGFSGDGGPATAATLYSPAGVAVDAAGNLVIADTWNGRVRVVANTTGTYYGQPMTAGNIYTVAGGGTTGLGDGGPAAAAQLDLPGGVTVDSAGNLLIADTNDSRIRVVAGSTGTFYGQPMTAGDIYTVAGGGTGLSDGGPATQATLNYPNSVAIDGTGNLLIADTLNNRIRVVAKAGGTFYGQAMTAGDIYTVAGSGNLGFSGDRGPATAANLFHPSGVAVDSGNLILADTDNNRIRMVQG